MMRHDHQQIVMKADCTIEYDRGRIVLIGAPAAVHHEAGRIIRRFARSGRPFEIEDKAYGRIVLRRLRPKLAGTPRGQDG